MSVNKGKSRPDDYKEKKKNVKIYRANDFEEIYDTYSSTVAAMMKKHGWVYYKIDTKCWVNEWQKHATKITLGLPVDKEG
ncbi:MAG: hypothetical protein GY941_22775 [Planctomycetes bacterium]|nr:hypothetical protein [Planctomycetota bacterium]